jgi:N,N'-diacetyllegionaminate synthase
MGNAMTALDFIAEIAQAHEGSLGMAHAYIDALAATGVNAVKFQIHIAAAESSAFEPFRTKFSREDATRFDYWKRMEFTEEQWIGIKQHCDKLQLEFLASPFSIAAVDLLERLQVRRYKIGSGEVSNLLMIERIARTGKPIILSSGLSTLAELDETVAFLRPFGNALSMLQCTTSYPTPHQHVGLNVLQELRERYGTPIGLSDHSGTIFPGLAAVALGADLLEFHAVFDSRMFGPDVSSSLDIDEISQLVLGAKAIRTSLDNPVDKTRLNVSPDLKLIFGKSLAVNRALPAGHLLTLSDLESKKPGNCGIPAASYREVLGRRLTRDLPQWNFLSESDLEGQSTP